MHKIFSGPTSDERPSGMVMDGSGNVSFTANVGEVLDTFYDDIMVAQMAADGSVNWAKIWNGPYQDGQWDPTDNDEGGVSHSIAQDADGDIYFVGKTATSVYNSLYRSLIVKVDGEDGSIIWEKAYMPNGEVGVGSDSSEFTALAIEGSQIYVVGQGGVDGRGVLLAVFDLDGNLLTSNSWELYNDLRISIALSLAVDDDDVYIGGTSAGDGFMMHVTDGDGTPTVDWSYKIGATGSQINSMDIGPSGEAYFAYYLGGANTDFVYGRMGSTGTMAWVKQYADGSGSKDNIHAVKYDDGYLFALGRTGPDLLDGQMGDAAIVKVDASDGSEVYTAEYFTGKGADEMAEHRVRGIGVYEGELVMLAQAWTATSNYDRYWGYWYEGSSATSDYTLTPTTIVNSHEALSSASTMDASTLRSSYSDVPTSVVWSDADEAEVGGTDGAIMLMTITEKTE